MTRLTTREAAQRLGVSTSTITRAVKHGRLTPVFQFPGSRGGYLFDPEAVDSLAVRS